ncbi:unnamed protein product [Rotaria sordida]|nr:unnamed protein product [Rotaria sordida]
MDVNMSDVQNDRQLANQGQRKKKCHGNRRDQRFRKKRRARGVQREKIEKLLQTQKKILNKKKNSTTNKIKMTTTDDHTVSIRTTIDSTVKKNRSIQPRLKSNINKRKRDISLQQLNLTIPKSTSSISILQSSRKKIKNKKQLTTSSPSIYINNNNNTNYRRPMYLKRSPLIIIKMLNNIFNYTLKETSEKRFIWIRLGLLDGYYCVKLQQQLWKSYLDIGTQVHCWPDCLYKKVESNDFEMCHQYLKNYINELSEQMKQCQIEVKNQSKLCPFKELSLDTIDQCLNQFVECQRNYLFRRHNRQVIEFKNNLHAKQLWTTLSTNNLTFDRNKCMNELWKIREKQGGLYEEVLTLEMRILCKFLPEKFDHLQYFIAPITYTPLNNDRKAIEVKNKHYKIIQEAKRIWLILALHAYHIRFQEYERQYENILLQLQTEPTTSTTVNGLSLFDQIKEYLTDQTKKLKRDIYKKVLSFRQTLIQIRQHSSLLKKNIIGVSPEPYLDLISNPFTKRQWNHLSLGPSCIRLNQSSIRSRKQQKKLIENEHKRIYTTVTHHLISPPHRIPMNSLAFKTFSNELLNYFNRTYFHPISYKDQIRTMEQTKMMISIRRKIQKLNLILRMTDKGHNFYIGSYVEFEKKAQQFFQETNAFMELVENPFNEALDKVVQLLNRLREKKVISAWQYNKMMPNLSKCELAHLYFNPKTHKEKIQVRPIENTISAPTTNISNYLDQIIRPIFNNQCSTTSIIDGTSLIKKLLEYSERGLLKSTTLFCTFDIRNLYTMLPQEEALNILIEFLHVYGYNKVKGISLDTIRKLAAIVLKENVFVYGKKFYRQTLGGAMGSSFTLTLANIFMWKWQKELVRRQDMTGEFYGRYIDDIFMTWNQSEKELKDLLDKANTRHSNIKLEYKISKSLPFLDVLLTNNTGILSTSLYHKPAAEPYVVPFISDHPRHTFVNVIQTNLARAIRYSSTFDKFNNELCHLKLTLLLNG